MDGLLFYLAGWTFWVILTFFTGKQHKSRTWAAAAVLAAIILSPLHVKFATTEVYAGGLFLFLASITSLQRATKKEKAYFYICALIISISYSTGQFFSLFDPVVFLIKKEWMLSIILSCLVIMLQRTLKGRLFVIVFGTMQGELLTAMILNRFNLSYEAGGFLYLDQLSLITLFLAVWTGFEKAAAWLSTNTVPVERSKKIPHE